MKSRILSTLFLSLLCIIARAQPPDNAGAIPGVARDATTGAPLSHAKVYLFERGILRMTGNNQDAEVSVVTDADGRFSFHWPVGAGMSREAGREGPSAFVVPFNLQNWKMSYSFTNSNEHSEREFLEGLAREAKTRWQENNGVVELFVPSPSTGEAEVLVRAPGGAPLALSPVDVFMEASENSRSVGEVHFQGATDASGRFRLRRFPGLHLLRIAARGAGFGASGLFEIRAATTTEVTLPPLARFATISGVVDQGLTSPETQIVAEVPDARGYDTPSWPASRAAVDGAGRFVLRDVVAGNIVLRVEKPTDGKSVESQTLQIAPGATRQGIALHEEPKPDAATPSLAPPKPAEFKPFVTGTVRDEAGAPVAGANVYVLCNVSFFARYQEILKAVTDADGKFLIKDLPGEIYGSVFFIAARGGGPPAYARGAMPYRFKNRIDATAGETNDEIKTDLVLPARGGVLALRVVHEGQPARNVWVSLSRENSPEFRGEYGGSSNDKPRDELRKILHPFVMTGEDGVARFSNLAPGVYRAIARQAKKPDEPLPSSWDFYDIWGDGGHPIARNQAHGIAVVAGEERAYALSIFTSIRSVPIRVLTPDGAPVSNQTVGLDYGLATIPRRSSSGVSLDGKGEGKTWPDAIGLWSYNVRFNNWELKTLPVRPELAYGAGSVLAVSNLVKRTDPVVMQSGLANPGTLVVELRDAKNRPSRGSVIIEDSDGAPLYATSTDAKGVARFPSLPSQKYLLRGYIENQLLPLEFSATDSRFPTDEFLKDKNRSSFAWRETTVETGREERVELRAMPASYLKGRVLAPGWPKGWSLQASGPRPTAARLHVNAQSREFIYGPLSPGEHQFVLWHLGASDDGKGSYIAEVKEIEIKENEIEAGKITALSVAPRTDSIEESHALFPQIYGLRPALNLTGRVLQSDGKTPVANARVRVYQPDYPQPIEIYATDALGRLQLDSPDAWSSFQKPDMQGSPTGTVAVALVPGETGATIYPLTAKSDEQLTLTLPPAMRVLGALTIGGKAVGILPANLRVAAAYEGKGKLDEILSFDISPQSDGSFELRGLTPGRYRVQAALDDIWLSRTTELVVAQGGASTLPPLALDIAPPGAAVELQIETANKNLRPPYEVEVLRPPGPLTERFWPKVFSTDARGVLRLEGLEAGTHAILVRAGKAEWKKEIVVPPLGEATQATVTRVLRR